MNQQPSLYPSDQTPSLPPRYVVEHLSNGLCRWARAWNDGHMAYGHPVESVERAIRMAHEHAARFAAPE